MTKMSSTQCQIVRKSSKTRCPNPAVYDIDGALLCGVHARDRKDPKYLIANRSRNAAVLEAVKAEEPLFQTVLQLRGLLLNSAVSTFEYRGIFFKTAEHAYQAMKFYYPHNDRITSQLLIEHVWSIIKAKDISEVRKLGHSREVPIRPDWWERDGSSPYTIRDLFMFDILEQKFAPSTRSAHELMLTGDRDLVDNSSNGKYWSNGASGLGQNKLGELLMMIRLKLGSE